MTTNTDGKLVFVNRTRMALQTADINLNYEMLISLILLMNNGIFIFNDILY
jgi:hypothetical protein